MCRESESARRSPIPGRSSFVTWLDFRAPDMVEIHEERGLLLARLIVEV